MNYEPIEKIASTNAALSRDEVLASLQKIATERKGVSYRLAQEAASVTRAHISVPPGSLGKRDKYRIESYFWAVISKRSARRKNSRKTDVQKRVLAALVCDLKEQGRTEDEIQKEIQEGYAYRFSQEALSPYKEECPQLTLSF